MNVKMLYLFMGLFLLFCKSLQSLQSSTWYQKHNNGGSRQESREKQVVGGLMFEMRPVKSGDFISKRSAPQYIRRLPESPRDIVIETQEAPKENEAEITWTRTYYSFVELTCNQQCCGENRFFRLESPPFLVKPIRSGVMCSFRFQSVRVDPQDFSIEKSKPTTKEFYSYPSKLSKLEILYRYYESDGSSAFEVRAQWYGIDGEIDSVVSKVYLVLNSNEKLYLTEYTSYVNDKSNTYVVKRHKITDHSIIRPGYLYEFHAKSFGLGGLSSPAIISTVIIPPAPPQNFTLTSHPAYPVKEFSWLYIRRGRQDLVVIRICLMNDVHTCVFEKNFTEDLPVRYIVRERLANEDYLAYAFSFSQGQRSIDSNMVSFKSETKYCAHPDNLKGQIVNSEDSTLFFFKTGSRYKLKCNKNYILVPLKDRVTDLTWVCNKQGNWVATSTCMKSTSFVLLITFGSLSGGIMVALVLIYLIYSCKNVLERRKATATELFIAEKRIKRTLSKPSRKSVLAITKKYSSLENRLLKS